MTLHTTVESVEEKMLQHSLATVEEDQDFALATAQSTAKASLEATRRISKGLEL